ncbi:MAG: hypothetical protein GY803_10505 [Chloroflexi bacterium]|nr:hypothetical protein [Chloroflexota bacterium]
MIDKDLIESNGNWRQKIVELESLLDEIRPQLIEAEANLADRLSAISAFEFKLRKALETLTRQLEKLQAEIDQYRQHLRQMQEKNAAANGDGDWRDFAAWDFDAETAAASGDYRYRETPPKTAPPSLNQDDAAALKQLYRQLARRFHPDLALDDNDRAYRTNIMKAINAAYSTGDLDRLRKLAQEPDSADRIEYAHTDQQLVQALYAELIRCRRRLAEIKEELIRLEAHKSAYWLRRVKRAEARGEDLLAKIKRDLQGEIAHKMIERDILKQQIEQFGKEEPDLGGDAFADAVLDLSHEGVFNDEDTIITARWTEHADWDDDILDDRD